MVRQVSQLRKRLAKKAKKGFRGYPVVTIAFYGPDDRRASKLVAAIVEREHEEPSTMRKWFSDVEDLRTSFETIQEVESFLREFGALSIVMTERIIGCPHEEGTDYDGPICPHCPFWANRDRWTGEIIR